MSEIKGIFRMSGPECGALEFIPVQNMRTKEKFIDVLSTRIDETRIYSLNRERATELQKFLAAWLES